SELIVAYFADKHFAFPPMAGFTKRRWMPHPPYHAYVQTLFWNFMRPSEASGLWWGDVDLDEEVSYIRRSRHLYEYGEPNTKQAIRTIDLPPETVRLLRALQPLHATHMTPVFTTTTGEPIEPRTFAGHWYACLRTLGIRQRGLYCTKDTCVTTALQ